MVRRAEKTQPVVLTVGHSTRGLDTFLHLLQVHGVTRLVDVRTIPKSRHNPQFNKETLPAALKTVEIAYQHMPELGGLRHSLPNSPNQAWHNASFRGFADYMQTPEFDKGLQKLVEMARNDRVAILCAEAVPWRCHRSLIADALVARHIRVEHIMSETLLQTHVVTPWACIKGNRVTYPTP
ncbi:MAG: DUF488 domain-containing protein [Thermoguttaceae bacterium]